MVISLFPFRSAVEAIKRLAAKPQDRADALSIFEDMDRCRNLHTSVAILSFLVSAGFGVFAFFLINESLLWAGITKQAAVMLVSLSWVLIFPIWALIFLFIMFLLGAIGIKDVRSVVRSSLSKLPPSQDRLDELRGILVSRNWRHGNIFRSVIADLTKEQVGC